MKGQVYYHPDPNPKLNKMGVTNAVQVRCVVYTPPDYDAKMGGLYPVLYLLHGVGDSEKSWVRLGKASTIVDRLLHDVTIRPMVVVMPFGFESNEQRSRKEFPDEDWFDDHMSRVIAQVERAYRVQVPTTADTRSLKRAIAGLSMGGKQALEFGLSHLKLFSAIGNFSGAIQIRGNRNPLTDLLAICRTKQARLKSLSLFYHAWGRDDNHRLVDANEKLVDELEKLTISPQVKQMKGGHDWTVWRACLKDFLTLLGREWCKAE